MREPLPCDLPAERPISEELKEEAKRWSEPPKTSAEQVRTEHTAAPPRAVRYDLD